MDSTCFSFSRKFKFFSSIAFLLASQLTMVPQGLVFGEELSVHSFPGQLDEEKIAIRKNNILLMQQVLKKGEYEGYDIIIVSSTTQEEADFQQLLLEKAFEGTSKVGGSKPIILSVVDSTEGGQIIGAIYTWLRAEEKLKQKYPHLISADISLLEYARETYSKIAVYHNGGKGERCSPLTQSLGNSRGAQKLVGYVKNAMGAEIELDVLLGVILQCSSFALTNDGTHIDTFWTSQIAFGSYPHHQLTRSNYAIDKFLVGFDKNQLIPQNIADFGTAALSKLGQMRAFYGNKRFASRKGSQYVIDKNKIEAELLSKGDRVAYDFGSFSSNFEMWQLMIDYWKRKNIFEGLSLVEMRSKIKRDIDPHFIQPLIRLVYGINDLTERESIDQLLPQPSDLVKQEDLDQAREKFNAILKKKAPQAYAYIWEDFNNEKELKKKAESAIYMNEVIEFYLLYRQTQLFSDLNKIFGYIDLGDETQWFRYRRPIDIMNEKFEMLTDMIGKKVEVQLDGSIMETETDAFQIERCIESRLMRGIHDEEIATFTVEGNPHKLTLSEVKSGLTVDGVYIKNSIIQNCDLFKGSSIINSVVHKATGRVVAENSYIESSACPLINANTSVVHLVLDPKPFQANKEVVSDVYRTKVMPFYCGRMRAPIGYDPKGMPIYKIIGKNEDGSPLYSSEIDPNIKEFVLRIPYDLKNIKEFSDETARTEDGRFTFEEIRRIEPLGIADIQLRKEFEQLIKFWIKIENKSLRR